MEKLRPLRDRILVKRIKAEERSKGGILLPETARERPTEGIAVAVGDGKLLDNGAIHPLAVKAGDRILFGKYSGTEIKVEGEELLIVAEGDVLGIFDVG